MKFTVAGSRIVCSRKDNTAEVDETYRCVVEFDAQVETVPPHVAARLTHGETEELRHFLADRQRIQASSVEQNMLEALPGLLQEATQILQSAQQVNRTLYAQLATAIADMQSALENIKPAGNENPTPLRNMRHTEAQKQRLENIKQDL